MPAAMLATSSNPAIHAYKVYHLSQTKLDKECRRQTPDLHRIVLHASIVDNVRRWSRDLATPAETVVVDSDSDTDSDPFDDSAGSEDDEAEDAVAIFDIEVDDDTTIEEQTQASGKVTYQVQHVQKQDSKASSASPKRRAPPPPTNHELKSQTWKQNRPVTVRETAVEVDNDD